MEQCICVDRWAPGFLEKHPASIYRQLNIFKVLVTNTETSQTVFDS